MKKIYLLTGPKNSGKSTRLMNWVKNQSNVVGIVCPREKGEREFYSIDSKVRIDIEVKGSSQDVYKIGKYQFLKSVFIWAEKEIFKTLTNQTHWIVIDEVGPLELRGEGFDPMLKKILTLEEMNQTKLLIVVREGLQQQVIEHYQLEQQQIEYVDFI